ncbi:hypothetical protein [Aurantiacibacter poecillastricola]|uniref:hypothetical protein n=1 Tax=Aurantiacibacter poecillastricola TaxID=3064385 RepID=UPI00273FFCCC|nr:hypothetical protein [Aurantiacibacter sp. 219JJ12-13]MDP5262133.1 hypothetical protein [Aurantiacibacter sp. 219JJ12-13]
MLEPWRAVEAETGQIADAAGLEALARDFPNSASVRLRLLNVYFGEGDADGVFDQVMWLVRRGYQFSSGAEGQIADLFDGEKAAQVLQAFAEDPAPLVASTVVATLPREARLPESVLSLDDGRYMVTDVILRGRWLGKDGAWEFHSRPDLGNVSGLAQDPGHPGSARSIWMASGNLGMVPEGTEVFSGLIQGEDGERHLLAPEGANLSDIAVGADGAVYASDPSGGGVYRLTAPDGTITTLVAPGTLRSPQGIAPAEDASRLYISDYRYGIAIVDTATGTVSRLGTEVPVLLDGIDGLWLHEGELIAVQNGISPMRIIALRLSDEGNRITAMRVLERSNPEWTEPLGGSIRDGALYYIGNGSWDLYEEGGRAREGAQSRETHIRRLELAKNPTD